MAITAEVESRLTHPLSPLLKRLEAAGLVTSGPRVVPGGSGEQNEHQ